MIVVTWNARDDLHEMLESVAGQTLRSREVIVVDNGSVDGSTEMVRRDFPDALLLTLPENEGFAGPNNLALAHARGRFVVTVNNDVVLAPDFLEKLVACADSAPTDVFAIASKMLYYDRPDLIQTVGSGPLANGGTYNIGKDQPATAFDQPMELYAASAGATLYRKEVLDRIGFFDARLFAYGEDLDLTLRARKAGYRTWYCPDAVCYHKHSKTSATNPYFKIYLLERNRLVNLVKHFPRRYLLLETPLTLWVLLRGRFGRRSEAELSSDQRAMLQPRNLMKLLRVYLAARWWVIRHYREFAADRRSGGSDGLTQHGTRRI